MKINIQKSTLLILILYVFEFSIFGQDEIFNYPDPVLPDSVPRIFAPGYISIPEVHEEGISFSPDGKEIFFTAIKTLEKGEKESSIYYLSQLGNIWSPVKKAPFSYDANESDPGFSADGNTLFYFSERRKPGITPFIGEIWQVTREGGKWSQPVYRENILNETWINSISSTAGHRLYFSSFREKQMGIFYTEKTEGELNEPIFLPGEVNSIAGASNPFISRDESMLVFEGQNSGYGNTELYISFKTSTGLWTPAVRLNESINKTSTETNPSFSPDGKFLFFTREGDLYWVRIEYVF